MDCKTVQGYHSRGGKIEIPRGESMKRVTIASRLAERQTKRPRVEHRVTGRETKVEGVEGASVRTKTKSQLPTNSICEVWIPWWWSGGADGKGFSAVLERRREKKGRKARRGEVSRVRRHGGKKALQSQHFGSSRVIYAFNTRPRHPASHPGVGLEKIY